MRVSAQNFKKKQDSKKPKPTKIKKIEKSQKQENKYKRCTKTIISML